MAIQPIRLFGDPSCASPPSRSSTSTRSCAGSSRTSPTPCSTRPGPASPRPQIGVGLRVFTWNVEGEVGHLVNPVLDLSDGDPGRPRGLPVDPRADLRLRARAVGGRQRLRHVRRAGHDRGLASCSPGRSSTRPTTSTASCSSTGSTPRPARPAMKEIREAEWFGLEQPTVKVSPHPTRGLGLLMRVVFAGTPEVALPALDAVAASRHELVGVVTRPDAPPAAAAGSSPARSPSGRGARRTRAQARPPARPGLPGRAARPGAGLLPGRGVRRPAAAVGARHPRARLGQPALLAAAGLARRGAGAARDLGRRRGHRRDHVPDRQGARRRADVRRDDRDRSGPTDTAGDLLARLAEGGAGPAGRHPRRHRGRHRSRPGRSRPRASRSPPRSPSTTRGSTGPSRRSPSTAGSGPARRRPGAWTTYAGERVKLGPVTPTDGQLPPGDLEVAQEPPSSSAPAPSAVRLGEVKALGRKPMPAADWARGRRGSGRGDGQGDRRAADVGVKARQARVDDVDAICLRAARGRARDVVGRPPDLQGRAAAGFVLAPRAAQDGGRPRDRRGVRRPAGDPHPDGGEKEALVEDERPRSSPSTTSAATTRCWSSSAGSARSTATSCAEIITDAWAARAPESLAKKLRQRWLTHGPPGPAAAGRPSPTRPAADPARRAAYRRAQGGPGRPGLHQPGAARRARASTG